MKNLRNAFLGLGLAGAAVLAQASPIFLDFEGIADDTSVADFYNGGGGTNYGVSFSLGGVAQVDKDAGGSGDFANEPSPSTVVFFVDSTQSSFLNYAPGFNTSVSFFYSSVTDTNVKVYTSSMAAEVCWAALLSPANLTWGGATAIRPELFAISLWPVSFLPALANPSILVKPSTRLLLTTSPSMLARCHQAMAVATTRCQSPTRWH